MELKSLLCPHCGANTTNTQNCDYCGSLLVRFVDKGIDISDTSYINVDNVYPGLLTELRNNLKLQLENPNEGTCTTDIMWLNKNGDANCVSIGRSMSFTWLDNTPIELGSSHNGLLIDTTFSTYCDQEDLAFNKRADEQLSKFKKLKSFELFTSHTCSYKDEQGCSRYGREYAIDFGNDVEGATALISEILLQVYDLNPSDTFDIFTNVGGHNVYQARKAWYASHGFKTQNIGCVGIVALMLISTIAALYSMFA